MRMLLIYREERVNNNSAALVQMKRVRNTKSSVTRTRRNYVRNGRDDAGEGGKYEKKTRWQFFATDKTLVGHSLAE